MFDITTACNYKCLHCYNNSGKKVYDELSDKEIVDVANQVAAMHPKSVCLCGGEPMMRANIFDIIRILAPSVGAVNMVSNGSLLNKEKIKKLKDSGINSIQISLDGINEMQHDTFRGYSGAFKQAVNAIKLIKESGLQVLVSFIPNKLNHISINEYFELVHSLGVNSARVMPLIPIGRGSTIDSLLLNAEEYIELQLQIEKNKIKFNSLGMQVEWGDPLDHMFRFPNNEVEGLKNIQYDIKANGNIQVSAYLPVIVGNVRKHSLQYYWINGYNNIWYNEEMKKYLKKIETIYDINELEPKPYAGDYYYIEIDKETETNEV